MSFSDRRAMRHMKFPERGILRVTGFHEGHSHVRVTGIITAPGMAPANVEHKVEHSSADRGRWTGVSELAVLVDRADPARFIILWDEAPMADPMDAASQFGPAAGLPLGPDGQPITANMPPDIAARVEASLNQAFARLPADKAARAQAALSQAFGESGARGQALSRALGQLTGQQFGQPGGPLFNPAGGQPFGQPGGPPSGPAGGQPFGQPGGLPSGQAGPGADGFPQVSWTSNQDVPGSGPQGGFSPAQPGQFAAGGELASAIVLSAQDVAQPPGFAAPGGAVDLTLEVRRADGSIYHAHTTVNVTTPERRAAVATPGTRLSVTIDPNDPTRVQIDTYGLT